MGVDFFNCAICNEIFNDCGYYGTCSNCEEMMCGTCVDSQGKKYGVVEEDSEAALDWGDDAPVKCDRCSGEIITDAAIVEYLCALIDNTKEQVIARMKISNMSNK